MNKLIKRTTCFLIAGILAAAASSSVYAAPLSDIVSQTEELEDYLKTMAEKITAHTLKQEYLQEQIDDVNGKIEENNTLLTEAEDAAAVQYDAMKKRIVYLYESGDTSYLEALFSSESISDILNKFEYIDKVVGYDRDMLEKYYDAIQTIDNIQAELEATKNSLEELKQETVDNINAAVEVSNSATSELAADLGIDESEVSSLITDYIDEHGDEIREELEQTITEKQNDDPEYNWLEDDTIWETTTAEEETESAADNNSADYSDPETEAKYVEPETETTTKYVEPETETTTEYVEPETETTTEYVEPETETTTEYVEPETEEEYDDGGYVDDSGYSDAYLIACLVSGECGYASYEAQWAVADLILNRVESGAWSGSVYGVLHDPGQFDAVYWEYIPGSSVPSYLYYIANGPLDTSLAAAYEAIGNRGASHGYQFYCTLWFYEENPDLFVNTVGSEIGGSWFYNYVW